VTVDHFYTAFCKKYEALTGNAFEEEDKAEIRHVSNLRGLSQP